MRRQLPPELSKSQAFTVNNHIPDINGPTIDVDAETIEEDRLNSNGQSAVPRTRIHSELENDPHPSTHSPQSDTTHPSTASSYNWIPLTDLVFHPLNPRPWSKRYQAPVDDRKVAELMVSIQTNGYDESEPVLVRPWKDKLQLLKGGHRFVSMRELGNSAILACIREMDDKEAAIALVMLQGKEVDPWSRAEHAYACCQAYGGAGLMTVSEYAQRVGKDQSTVTNLLQAVRLKQSICRQIHFDTLSIASATEIASLQEQDWQWFSELHLERSWGKEARRSAIKVVKQIDIPVRLQFWLDPKQYKREAALEAAASNSPKLVNDIRRWVTAAQNYLEGDNQLPKQRPVWNFNSEGEPYREVMDVQQMFLAELPKLDRLSEIKIDKLAANILSQLKHMDETYDQWQAQQASAVAQQQQAEELAQRLLSLKVDYAPMGYNADIEAVELPFNYFDAVITDPNSALSNVRDTAVSRTRPASIQTLADKMALRSLENWVPIVAAELKPGGSFVVICSEAYLFTLHSVATHLGLEWQQTLVWHNHSVPTGGTHDRFQTDYQYVYIAANRGGTPYFGSEDLEHHFPDKQLSAILDIPQSRSIELAKLLTLAYVPPDGRVLDPFANTATFSVAAKQLGRKATWIEASTQLFHQAESRIEENPYYWEL